MVRFSLVFAFLALPACGGRDGGGTPDAGADSPTDGSVDGSPDAPHVDMGPPPMSTFLGECVIDEQCPGPGAICLTAIHEGFAGGRCTRECVLGNRTPCDDGDIYHHCLDHTEAPEGHPGATTYCTPRCLAGLDCRAVEGCAQGQFSGGLEGGICIPVCQTDDECGPGAQCNRDSGECLAAGEPLAGASIGESCANDDACRGRYCAEERNGSNPTGFNSGYCYGNCILPLGYNNNNFFAGEALPTGTCPAGNVCFPNGGITEGDLGVCFQECDSNSDCRVDEGYECQQAFATQSGDTARFSNGVCNPISCSASARCPAGFECRKIRQPPFVFNVCARLAS